MALTLLASIPVLAYAAGLAAQAAPTGEQLVRELGCARCHDGLPADSGIRDKAPDLTEAGLRYSPDYLFGFLQYPVRVRKNLGASRMPNFHLDEREALALVLFLGAQVPRGQAPPDRGPQEASDKARAHYPDVTAAMGRDIFRALNCVGCHRQSSIDPLEHKNAPTLAVEGARVTSAWLVGYLRAPRPIRLFGFYPGSGSRHPDFRLSDDEVRTVAEYLQGRRGVFDSLPHAFAPQHLSDFAMGKAKALIDDKLPCLGCHRLGDEGGIVGPDLSSVSERLQPGFVYEMVRDPSRIVPETVMPKVNMSPATLALIANYLVQQRLPRRTADYLSLVEHPPHSYQELTGGQRLHVKYCAPCHGVGGTGAGYNAQYLPVAPTKHADATTMAALPDDVVFDAISAGGYVMHKSNRMPPWGATLTPSEIRALIAYIRSVCRCQGPDWSRGDF
jgi:mono/diheme cytochrome c family protein